MTASEQRVIDALEKLGLPFERIRIDPAHADTSVFCAQYGYPPETSGNTIIVASKKEPKKFCGLCGPGHHPARRQQTGA